MRNHRLLILIFLVFALSACIGRKPVATRYFLIEFPLGTGDKYAPAEAEIVFPGPLLVMPVHVNPAYSSHQIAFREDTHQIKYFAQSEWAVRPAQSFDLLLSRFFGQNEWFSDIEEHRSMVTEGYTLETNVMNLEVSANRQLFSASLTIEFNLTDNRTGMIHTSGVVERQQLLRSKDLNMFAASVSELFLDELHKFLGQVHSSTHD